MLIAGVPLKRAGTPEEIAQTIVFLAFESVFHHWSNHRRRRRQIGRLNVDPFSTASLRTPLMDFARTGPQFNSGRQSEREDRAVAAQAPLHRVDLQKGRGQGAADVGTVGRLEHDTDLSRRVDRDGA